MISVGLTLLLTESIGKRTVSVVPNTAEAPRLLTVNFASTVSPGRTGLGPASSASPSNDGACTRVTRAARATAGPLATVVPSCAPSTTSSAPVGVPAPTSTTTCTRPDSLATRVFSGHCTVLPASVPVPETDTKVTPGGRGRLSVLPVTLVAPRLA